MKKYLLLSVLMVQFFIVHSQGLENVWLIGVENVLDPYTTSTRATIDFSSGFSNIIPTNRKIPFCYTQGNIADANGNLLISSNGIWIANATGDTMMNGSGLNPGGLANAWVNYGLPIPNGNLILPFPGDNFKYVLFHMSDIPCTKLYYTVIDMTLDNGFGGVIQKNQVAILDTLSWGIGACKHANGRDWWVVVIKDNSDSLYTLLLTPNGIEVVTTQSFSSNISDYGNATQPVFSSDGTKFAFTTSHSIGGFVFETDLKYFAFDRCTGNFSNYISVALHDSNVGQACAFSPNSQYLYAATAAHIFQINTDSTVLYPDTIATYDGFQSPFNLANFWLMYLAGDNRIYITSQGDVVDLHYINYPDSAGAACDVHLHDLHIPCYNWGSVPNHPNYFLGEKLGSICDTLSVGVNELNLEQSNLTAYPNPAQYLITVNTMHITGKTATISVLNLMGEIIWQKQVPVYNGGYLTQDIHLNDFSSGVYIVRLQTETAVMAVKFVKE